MLSITSNGGRCSCADAARSLVAPRRSCSRSGAPAPGRGRPAGRCSVPSRSGPTHTPRASTAASTSAPRSASQVLAPAAGTVSFAGSVPGGGRAITIQTPDGYAVTLLQLGDDERRAGATPSPRAPRSASSARASMRSRRSRTSILASGSRPTETATSIRSGSLPAAASQPPPAQRRRSPSPAPQPVPPPEPIQAAVQLPPEPARRLRERPGGERGSGPTGRLRSAVRHGVASARRVAAAAADSRATCAPRRYARSSRRP